MYLHEHYDPFHQPHSDATNSTDLASVIFKQLRWNVFPKIGMTSASDEVKLENSKAQLVVV